MVVVLLRIRASEVPRGTPWIWFLGTPEVGHPGHPGNGNSNSRRRFAPPGFMDGTLAEEMEVLLPPGTVRVDRVSTDRQYPNTTTVFGTYTPDPAYLARTVPAPRNKI